jgi:hypothetical protein
MVGLRYGAIDGNADALCPKKRGIHFRPEHTLRTWKVRLLWQSIARPAIAME